MQRPGSMLRNMSRGAVLRRVVWWLAAVCACLVPRGSCDFQTTRTWPDGSAVADGAAEWAGWTFISGAMALGFLVAGALLLEDQGRRLAVTASLLPFVVAALIALLSWARLRSERAHTTEYVLDISLGLPLVAVAASVGGLLALLLAAVGSRHPGKSEP